MQICDRNNYQPPHEQIPSSQIAYNLSGINVEDYLISTANDFIRNRYMQPVFASYCCHIAALLILFHEVIFI